MADGGIGEAALLGAALGGGSSMISGRDPLQGALMGGLLGGVGGAAFGPGAEAAAGGAGAAGAEGAFTAATPTGLAALPADVGAAASPGISSLLPQTLGGKIAAGTAGLGALAMLSDRNKYGMPAPEKYSGPLSKFQYDPATYQPYVYKPYANGGPIEAMSNANSIGQNTGFPQADIRHGAYATPWQTPVSRNMLEGAADTGINPISGEMNFASGGITGSGELNLNIPLDFGGGAVGGFGQSPNGTGLNSNQGPLDLGQGNNSGFGQANANGYRAAGSGTPFSSSLTGSPNTVGLSQNPFSMLLPGGYNPPAGYSPEQAQSGMSFEEMVRKQQGLDAQRTTPQIMQERLAQQTIREAKAAEDAKKYTRDFSSFGFDKKLLDYLNNQRAASTYDGGIDYAYDPVTQTFRGGARGGPVTKTLDEMQAYANKGMASGGLAALAAGGMYNLGGYSDGGRLLRGPGDGVSDSIPAVIGGKQPARLADGEFVVPARIVSEIGNGSTDAGARELYKMMDRVQSARGKTTGKGKMAKDTKATKYLPA